MRFPSRTSSIFFPMRKNSLNFQSGTMRTKLTGELTDMMGAMVDAVGDAMADSMVDSMDDAKDV